MGAVKDLITTLTHDGDTWWNDDETVGYRLTIAPDEYESGADTINGCDCYGRVELIRYDRCTGKAIRPDDFDGSAEKIGDYWWAPYREGRKVYNDAQSRSAVRDLLEYGPQTVAITQLARRAPDMTRNPLQGWRCWDCGSTVLLFDDDVHTCDGCIVERDVACVGSVEPFPSADYVADIVADLLGELMG
jgi:hypothetical protein